MLLTCPIDRPDAEHQAGGDLLVRITRGQQPQNLELALGELVESTGWSSPDGPSTRATSVAAPRRANVSRAASSSRRALSSSPRLCTPGRSALGLCCSRTAPPGSPQLVSPAQEGECSCGRPAASSTSRAPAPPSRRGLPASPRRRRSSRAPRNPTRPPPGPGRHHQLDVGRQQPRACPGRRPQITLRIAPSAAVSLP